MKYILSGTPLPIAWTPFEMLLGRCPRTKLDNSCPPAGKKEEAGGLEKIVEEREQTFNEVQVVLEIRHAAQEEAKQKNNANIQRVLPGVQAVEWNIALVKEAEKNL